MKLLVTGGAGFIGSNFVRYWNREHPEDEIVVLDKLTYAGNKENLHDTKHTFVKGDICEIDLVNELMRGVDIVAHFAAESHVDRSISNAAPFLQTNIFGTYVLLDAAVKHKVKHFHHVSTDEVFGSLDLGTDEYFRETTAYDPKSPYAASKASSDHLVRSFSNTFGLKYTITNCSNNYGPYQYPEKLIPLAITNVILGKPIPVYGDGQNVRDWLHVEDHCRAIDMVIQKGENETYVVGGHEDNIANIDIVKTILQLMSADESLIEYVTDRKGHDRRYAVDWSKIRKEIGWEPKYFLDDGLEKTVGWYISNGDWWQPLRNDRKD